MSFGIDYVAEKFGCANRELATGVPHLQARLARVFEEFLGDLDMPPDLPFHIRERHAAAREAWLAIDAPNSRIALWAEGLDEPEAKDLANWIVAADHRLHAIVNGEFEPVLDDA